MAEKEIQSKPPPAVCRFRFVDLLIDLFKHGQDFLSPVCLYTGVAGGSRLSFGQQQSLLGGLNDCCEQLCGTSLHLCGHVH